MKSTSRREEEFCSYGKRLKKIQDDHGLNNKEIAQLVNVHNTTWSRYLNDHMHPKQDVVDILCDTFHVNAAWLTHNQGKMYEDGYIPASANQI